VQNEIRLAEILDALVRLEHRLVPR